jgi:hypothetical protein
MHEENIKKALTKVSRDSMLIGVVIGRLFGVRLASLWDTISPVIPPIVIPLPSIPHLGFLGI